MNNNIELQKSSQQSSVRSVFNVEIWNQIKSMAKVFKEAKVLPANDNEFSIVMKIQAGYEMGMQPIESIKSFYFVNGTINIFGAAVTRRLREHGWEIKYEDKENSCTATVKKGNEEYSATLTFDEAVKSGWTQTKDKSLKPGWTEGVNRKLKLRYGALSILIKTQIAEVLGSATDIAEVAMDMGQAFAVNADAVVVPQMENGDQPAEESQLETIRAMGGTVEDEKIYTKEEAAQIIAELSAKPKKGKTE